jgi:DNA-binding NarL/FixJ family response regulator
LDLKLPDLDDLEVLRLVSDKYPDLEVIIITAYGAIEAAVEAMKTGAVNFLQKPLAPIAVHNMVTRVLQGPPEDQPIWKYEYYLDMAMQSIASGEFDVARVYAKKAIFLDHQRPEVFNMLGGYTRGQNRSPGSRQELSDCPGDRPNVYTCPKKSGKDDETALYRNGHCL